MSTHNICFYGELENIPELLPNLLNNSSVNIPPVALLLVSHSSDKKGFHINFSYFSTKTYVVGTR